MNLVFSSLAALAAILCVFVACVAFSTYRLETSWSKMAWTAASTIVVASLFSWVFIIVALKYAAIFMG
jgi:hypothetical protein